MNGRSMAGDTRPTKTTKSILAILLAAGVIGSVGCGGGGAGGGGGADTQGAAALVEQGRASLNSILKGSTMPGSDKLTQVSATFEAAYKKDPANRQAAFGYGVSAIAASGQSLLNLWQSRATGAAPSDPGGLGRIVAATRIWTTDGGSPVGGAATVQAVMTPVMMSRATAAFDPTALRASLSDLQQALDRAIPAIEQAAAAPAFQFDLIDWRSGAKDGSTIRLGQGEAQAFLAALHTVRAAVNLALAYDFDPRGSNMSGSIQNAFGAQMSSGATVAPSTYLPPAPYGRLLDGGKDRFASAKTDLNAAADTALATAATIKNRAAGPPYLLDGSRWDLAKVQQGVSTARSMLSTPFTVSIEYDDHGRQRTTDAAINLSAWFSNPPADLRSLLPAFHGSADAGGELVTSRTDYPDPTFGDLLPNAPAEVFQQAAYGSQNVGHLQEIGFPFLRASISSKVLVSGNPSQP